MEKDIEKLAYEEVTKKLKYMQLKDIGPFFHGWFDCLHFMDSYLKDMKEIHKGIKKEASKEEMLEEIFKEIEIETEGMVPVRWRYKGSPNWKKCIYKKETEA